jgi:hypothetical protein
MPFVPRGLNRGDDAMAGPRKWLVGTAVVLLAAWVAAADGPKPPLVGPPEPTPRMPRADPDGLVGPDGLQLPPDAKAVVLPRDKYQELMEELARLREQAKPGKPLVPSFCDIKGQIDGELARLRVNFRFRTERDNQRVSLGCAAGNPTDANLDDGQLPNFSKTADFGFVVQVDKAGKHEFQLHLELAVVAKENERSFSLDLPGAAVTTLDLELPEGVSIARVGPDAMKAEPLENKRNHVKGPLGPLQKLDVAWASGTAMPPLLSADTRISVRVEETQIVTEAELTLKPLRGEPAEWTLQVPPQAELRKDERIQAVVVVDPKRSVRILKLTSPSSKELKVHFHVSQPRANGLIPIGPFAVLGATKQQGTLTISAPAELRITYHSHGDLSPRPISPDERKIDPNLASAFRFSSVADLEKPGVNPTQPLPPLVDVEIETIKGEVDAHVKYDLRLVRPDEEARPAWRLTMTIEGTSHRTRAEHVRVQLPVGFQFDDKVGVQPTESVQGPEINTATRVATFTLFQKKPDPFQVVFQGAYAPLADDERATALDLPQILGVHDKGAVVSVNVLDDWKLTAPRMPSWRESVTLEAHKQVWRYKEIPSQIALEWEPTRPDAPPARAAVTDNNVRVERTLIQVTVGVSGFQNYRAWFLVKTGGAKTLDMELPAPLAGINLKFDVDGKPVRPTAVDESGKPAEVSKIARVPLAASADHGPVLLRLEYQLPPGRTGGSGLLQTALQPPVVRGETGWNPVRWQVAFPSSWLPLDTDANFRAEQRWGWRGWLVGLKPAPSNGDVEGWSLSSEATGMPPTTEGEAAGPPSLVGWQTTAGPLRLTHAPQQGWLLICSLALLVVGLVVSQLKRPRGLGWLLALVLGLAAAGVGLYWPSVLASVMYGCEPAMVVLLLVLGSQWLLHQRYRRQVVFLPGFKRTKGGSALVRGSSNRPRTGEPSTVDAPPPVAGSSHRTAGAGSQAEGGSVAKPAGDSRNR